MMDNLESFTYVTNPKEFRTEIEATVVLVPPNISDREELFKIFEEQLKTPYFGNNWDSLDELLYDFSWLKSKKIVILHTDLPARMGEKNVHTYLDILLQAVQNWQAGEAHELIVVFPGSLKEEIRRILQK